MQFKKLLLIFLLVLGCGMVMPTTTYAKSTTESSTVETPKKTKKKKKKKYITTTIKVKKKTYLGKFFITHYCPCSRCCGVGGGKVTASGTRPTAGRTVGVNPRLIKYGTKLKVGKKSGYVAEDTGGGIGWKHLDIFCNSHQEALNAGVGYENVWAITYTTKKVRMYEVESKPMKNKKIKYKEYL